MPEDGYGWEKLFSERMCRHFLEDFNLDVSWLDIIMFTDQKVLMMVEEKAPAAF